MRIYLIRHGQQDSELCNVNVGLSDEGRRQSYLAGRRLKHIPIDLLYSSALIRAVETADLIKECLDPERIGKPEHRIREALNEADFGELTGIPDAVIAVRYRDFMESRYRAEGDWAYPGGESGWDIYRRVKPVWEEILASGAAHTAVVTHGGVIRTLLAVLLQGSPDKRLQFGSVLYRGGITELFYEETTGRLCLERFNDRTHLEPFPR